METYKVYVTGRYLGDFTSKQAGDRIASKSLNPEAVAVVNGNWRRIIEIDDVLAAAIAAKRRRNAIWMTAIIFLFATCSYLRTH